MSNPYELSDDMPVYVISVAAQLSDMHPQTLRAYDRLGLVSPGRSQGRGRRYSMRDILALREIQRLSREGVNLSGIKMLLDQHRELEQARRLIAELHAELARVIARALDADDSAAIMQGIRDGKGTAGKLVFTTLRWPLLAAVMICGVALLYKVASGEFPPPKLRGPAAPISMSGMTRLATPTPNTAVV